MHAAGAGDRDDPLMKPDDPLFGLAPKSRTDRGPSPSTSVREPLAVSFLFHLQEGGVGDDVSASITTAITAANHGVFG